MNHLSPRVRRTLALGILLILLCSLWTFGYRPLWQASSAAIERLQDARFALARARYALDARQRVSDSAIAQQELAVQQRLLAGDSAAGATGALQASVSQLARDNGLQLDSMSAEPLVQSAPLGKVGVLLKAHGSEAALVKMLAALETQTALLMVDRLVVGAQDLGQTAAGGATTGVAVEVRIVGYWAAPLPAPAPERGRT
ncbi:MAG: type II secretion system protein GspM [Pseudomonadota bacterium]